MKDLNLIFIVDKNWNIGVKGDMLYKTKEDLEHFKEITYGNILVMGRRTLEAMPERKGLKGRVNIVMSRRKDFQAENIILVNSIEELEREIEKYDEKIFLIGGGHLVKQLFEFCNYAYITKLDADFPDFDTSIPNLDKLDDWVLVKEEETFSDGKYDLKFLEYKRREK